MADSFRKCIGDKSATLKFEMALIKSSLGKRAESGPQVVQARLNILDPEIFVDFKDEGNGKIQEFDP